MGRKRKPLQAFLRGRLYHTRFLHPLIKKTVSISLGGPDDARKNLDALNEIFLHETRWTNPPATTPASILRQWNRTNSVTLSGSDLSKAGKLLSPLRDEEVEGFIKAHPALARYVQKLVDALAMTKTQATAAADKVQECFSVIATLERELEHWKGKRLNRGPLPTLQKAKETFLKNYKGRDASATENIGWDLERFIKAFGPTTTLDKLEGKEREINAWIRGLTKEVKQGGERVKVPLSPARRMTIRLYVLKMLEECGATINRKLIDRPGKKETRAARGAIKYLSREQAEQLARKLPQPWADMFRVQVAIGLRPDELLTLQRDNFSADFATLDLQPMGALTLKTGTRHIPIPATIREIFRERVKEQPVVFPDVDTGKAWTDPKKFNRMFLKRLRKAAAECGITVAMDGRIGRRTCASLLVAQNISADNIAKLLGNSPEMILEHYGERDVKALPLEGVTTI